MVEKSEDELLGNIDVIAVQFWAVISRHLQLLGQAHRNEWIKVQNTLL